MKRATAQSALKVQAVLGDAFEVMEFEVSTRTAAEAAAAIGCGIAQIAKSLVFRITESAQPLLVVASGAHRIDVGKLAAIVGEPVSRADADFVRTVSGYAIGGVPPVGHLQPPQVIIDAALLRLPEIWAAAGTPNAVFRLTPQDLLRMTGGRIGDVTASE